ncbi:putative hemolysin [Comamonas thiooxydans]|uniref:putative hemolysin n=1 Tax=Comamonas thiooxydans TaxID=363952 RepID=UPI003D02A522
MKKALGTTSAVLSALAISGCAQPQSAAPVIGMANPASVYCAQLGGKTRIEKTTAGERCICVLPNGTEIDEWELFRRDHPAK